MDAVILAAGFSRRMGRQKMLLPFGTGTVLSNAVDSVRRARFERIVVVTSPSVAESSPSLFEGVELVVNSNPELGQSCSLRLGLEALVPGENHFCLLLGDMPLVSPAVIEELRQRFLDRPPGKTALIPFREGRYGHPSFYESLWKARLKGTQGDSGGRETIRRHWDEVLGDPGFDVCFMDMDTPEDYRDLLEKSKAREELA